MIPQEHLPRGLHSLQEKDNDDAGKPETGQEQVFLRLNLWKTSLAFKSTEREDSPQMSRRRGFYRRSQDDKLHFILFLNVINLFPLSTLQDSTTSYDLIQHYEGCKTTFITGWSVFNGTWTRKGPVALRASSSQDCIHLLLLTWGSLLFTTRIMDTEKETTTPTTLTTPSNNKTTTKTSSTSKTSSTTSSPSLAVRSSTRKKNVSSTVFFDCDRCQERFYSPNTLLRHHQSVHNKVKAVKRDHQGHHHHHEGQSKHTQTSTSSSLLDIRDMKRHERKGHYFSPDDPRDVAFFSSVSQKIAYNLLHHVDGKVDPKTKKTTAINASTVMTETPSIDLSFYNFPVKTSTCKSMSSRVREEEAKSGFLREICSLKKSNPGVSLLAATSTSTATTSQSSEALLVVTRNEDQPYDLSLPSSRSRQTSFDNEPLCLTKKQNQGSKELYQQQSSREKQKQLYICTVCNQRFPTRLAFFEHAMNNHPNTIYSYILIDSNSNIPDHLLCWRHDSPSGLLKSCDVSFYPSGEQGMQENTTNQEVTESVKCTRCSTAFTSRSSLREHVLDCARQARKEQKARGVVSQYKGYVTVLEPLVKEEDRLDEEEKDKKKDTQSTSDGSYTTRSGKKRALAIDLASSSNKSDDASTSKSSKKKKLGNKKTLVAQVTLSGQAVEAAMKALSPTLKKTRVESQEVSEEPRPETTSVISSDNQLPKINKLFIKKSHLCKKCGKKFAFTDSLKKHAQSCTNKAVTNANKRLLRQRFKSIISTKMKATAKAAKVTEAANKGMTSKSNNNKTEEPNNHDDEASPKDVEEDKEIKTEEVAEESNPEVENEGNKVQEVFVRQNDSLYAFKGSPAQHHSCPYCRRGFTYLANFRKHIKAICPIKQQEDDKKKKLLESSTSESSQQQTPTTGFKFNLNSVGTKSKFKTFSCPDCHRIYFSYLEMLKHRLSHKLSNNETGDSTTTSVLSQIKTELASSVSSLSSNISVPDTVKSAPDSHDDLLSLEEKAARDALALTHMPDRRRSSHWGYLFLPLILQCLSVWHLFTRLGFGMEILFGFFSLINSNDRAFW